MAKKRSSKYEKKLVIREDLTFDNLMDILLNKPQKKTATPKTSQSPKK